MRLEVLKQALISDSGLQKPDPDRIWISILRLKVLKQALISGSGLQKPDPDGIRILNRKVASDQDPENLGSVHLCSLPVDMRRSSFNFLKTYHKRSLLANY